jgi:hypothetical protein
MKYRMVWNSVPDGNRLRGDAEIAGRDGEEEGLGIEA